MLRAHEEEPPKAAGHLGRLKGSGKGVFEKDH